MERIAASHGREAAIRSGCQDSVLFPAGGRLNSGTFLRLPIATLLPILLASLRSVSPNFAHRRQRANRHRTIAEK
jgi:hypothetical protein